MCGISGIIGQIDNSKKSILKDMLISQAHRGPDGHRILITKSSLLGFSRLKIIDFNNRSMQPMVSEDKKHVLLFNGEIYNYKSLKNKIGNSYNFRTSSDTEVLLAVLILYGIKGLKYINGMFAFCYYDVQNEIYTLVRDRFGQKPLYFAENNNNFYFASEIKSLLAGGICNKANFKNVASYLYDGHVDCTNETFFKEIRQVNPGSFIQVKNAKIILSKKWYNIETIRFKDDQKVNSENIKYVDHLLSKVCEEHLNSDTPIGVALSGGLDSSSMLASMQKNKSNLSNTCFSVDYEKGVSEKKWIRSAAKYFDKKSIVSTYKVKAFLNDFDKMIYSHEGPLGGLANCAMENLYKKVNQANIKVLLDGTGLDEAFGGYRIHHLIYINRLLQNNDETYSINKDCYCDKWKINEEEFLKEINNLKKQFNVVQDGTSFNQNIYSTDFFESMRDTHTHKKIDNLADVRDHLINYLLCSKIPKNTRIKDRQSMSYSIELRMPFLDHRLIELGLSLEEESYFKGGLTKSIIRNVMQNKLPNTIRLSQKRSIQAPQAEWLSTPAVSGMVLDIINSNAFKERGIFNFKKIYSAFNDFLKYGAPNTFHIWQWINIEKFFQIFIDRPFKKEFSKLKIEFIELK